MGDLIGPGKYSIGSENFGYDYRGYAERLVKLNEEGRYIDSSYNFDIKRVLDYYGCHAVDELKYKLR